MTKIVTWVLVADGAVARVFANDGPGKGLTALAGKEWTADLPHGGKDVWSDRPGRSFESADSSRHSMEPTSDPKRMAKERFIAEVVDTIAKSAQQGAFDRLVVVAEPRTLGVMRDHMPDNVRHKVHAELAKDLTKFTADELAGPVGEVISL